MAEEWRYSEDTRSPSERQREHELWRAQRRAAEESARLTARRESDLKPRTRYARAAASMDWF